MSHFLCNYTLTGTIAVLIGYCEISKTMITQIMQENHASLNSYLCILLLTKLPK